MLREKRGNREYAALTAAYRCHSVGDSGRQRSALRVFTSRRWFGCILIALVSTLPSSIAHLEPSARSSLQQASLGRIQGDE
jgi:hypothetical protein